MHKRASMQQFIVINLCTRITGVTVAEERFHLPLQLRSHGKHFSSGKQNEKWQATRDKSHYAAETNEHCTDHKQTVCTVISIVRFDGIE